MKLIGVAIGSFIAGAVMTAAIMSGSPERQAAKDKRIMELAPYAAMVLRAQNFGKELK